MGFIVSGPEVRQNIMAEGLDGAELHTPQGIQEAGKGQERAGDKVQLPRMCLQ
jgi:hypothetical protein